MAAQKFLTNVAGTITEVQAISTSAGAGDAGKLGALDSTGKLSVTFMPTTVGTPTTTAVASEALAAGAFVNIYDNAGTVTVRNANATDGTKKAMGYVISAVSSAGTATVYLSGENTALTGLTTGSEYFLVAGATGTASTTAPTATGNSVESLGYAINPTTIVFNPQKNIILA